MTLDDISDTGLFGYDTAIRSELGVVCGIDEAGRGPLAGDVYAAAVILRDDTFIEGLDDSKKLSEKKREKLFDEIIEKADAYCIATATAAEIDEYNILGATFLAMKRACNGLGIKAEYALIDGNRTPELDIPCEAVVKGDSKSASIAAASILAKVTRDRQCLELDKEYPEYGIAKHKGYPTKDHMDAVRKYGVAPIYRRSFLKFLEKDEHS